MQDPILSKEQRQRLKEIKRAKKAGLPLPPQRFESIKRDIAFVLGNGISRKPIKLDDLKPLGKTYGCNALYRSFTPDYLVAVDARMVIEITRTGYQLTNQMWTNPNRSYRNIQGLNLFNPSKGWSSGPTALWLASQHKYKEIYILGFDYQGNDNGRYFNNMFADTVNYKKSSDRATFYGNWLKQTLITVSENPDTTYYRVNEDSGFVPKEMVNIKNLKHITVKEFKKIHRLT